MAQISIGTKISDRSNERPEPVEKRIRVLIDTSGLMKMGNQVSELSEVGYQLVLIPENIKEQKFLSRSADRQMDESFAWCNPLHILRDAKVIDTSAYVVKEEVKRIYSETKGILDSAGKTHKYEDADFTFLAVAKAYGIEIAVSQDYRLLRAIQKMGIHTKAIRASEFRLMVAERKRELMVRQKKENEQAEKLSRALVKCLVCGQEVRSGSDYQTHFIENHSLGKVRKIENGHGQSIIREKKQNSMKRIQGKVVSFTVCANVCSQSSEAFDHKNINRQATVAISSNASSQPDEIYNAELARNEGSKLISPIQAKEGISVVG